MGDNKEKKSVKTRDVKCVVVGDGAVGKSSMLTMYTKNIFDESYTPTIFENYQTLICAKNKYYSLSLWDTAGQSDFDRLRNLSYPDTDVFLICYDTNNKDSFYNLTSQWLPEIKHYCPDVPCLLVGLKSDLSGGVIKKEEVDRVSTEEKFVGNYLCSAKTKNGIKDLFDRVALIGYAHRKKKFVSKAVKKECIIL